MDPPRLRIFRFFAAIGVTIVAASIIVEASHLPQAPFLGMSERETTIGLIQPDGPADRAGLKVGDHILQVQGRVIGGLPDLSFPLRSGQPGDAIDLTIERDGVRLRAVLVPEAFSPAEIAWSLTRVAASLIALFVGSLVWLRRSRQLTLVFFLICLSLSFLLFFPYVPPYNPAWIVASLFKLLLNAFFPALFLHFFLLFPYERPILRRRPVLIRLLYVLSLGLFALAISVSLDLWSETHAGFGRAANGLVLPAAFAASFTASAWLFLRAFRRTSAPSIRKKLRVALWGTIVGVLPTVLVLVIYSLRPGQSLPLDRLATVALVLVPIGFGYAIVKHGVFDIERIVKRSLVVTAVTAAMILLYFLSYFLLRALLHSVTSLSGTLISVIAFLFVIVLFSPIRSRIEDLIDRSLYPERYESRRRLREFSRNLPQLSDETEIVRASLESAAHALGIAQGVFFPEEEVGYKDGFYWGIDSFTARSLRLGPTLRDPVYRRGEPLLREELDAEIPYGYLPEGEEKTLERIRAGILIPIMTGTSCFGVAVLGRRIDGDPYSGTDLEILESLAAQTALAMENARFQQQLRTKEAISRELAIAQSVQRQLLPQSTPTIPGVDLAATTLPCHEVGGDYFDYVETENGQLSIAVGDVSGKGVPAAILMANVQALFRAEARGEAEPDEVLARMNRRLCEIERPERFVSFFCARFDSKRLELRYSSAGHPPPFLVRYDGSLHHLDAGGLLLGIEPETPYPLGVVRLREGDLILCFTDGIADPLSDDAPFREDQLEEMVRSLHNLPAARLLERVLERIRETRILDDDTTLLILKIV